MKVRALAWGEHCGLPACHAAIASYLINETTAGEFHLVAMSWGGDMDCSTHESMESAKAAAQADFERRVLACLEDDR